MMGWYYFRREGMELVLVPRCDMPVRPSDARESDDEYEPWYQEIEHFDKEHVHVRGLDEQDAMFRGYMMLLGYLVF